MKDKMPPLQGLYYFYKAAQFGSFKLAAENLFVTSAAVSQQIRVLEEFLGTSLFIRQHRKVVLTSEGQILFTQAKKGFAHIQDGVRQINQDPDPNRLSISTLPSFAQNWLVPRVNQFRETFPSLSLLIEPTNRLVTFEDSSVDLCIRYGQGKYPNLESTLLMEEIIYPVCHPIYQEKHKIYDIDDLSRAELIEDSWPDMDWEHWLTTFSKVGKQSSIKYDGSHFVLEGALSVQGVALVKHSLARRYIEEGKLVRIGNKAMKPKYKYFLCAPKGYFKRKKVQDFQLWINEQVKAFQNQNLNDLEIIDSDYTLKWEQEK
ncbi:LysR substrate-binding domain-containing protein [Vibrio kagoshimensis]|uniref:LysR substrate-binding domain-containing protein n=1 Tax=Vibrio kagoshimensis TaxID=2910244 RepID=UPI002352D736